MRDYLMNIAGAVIITVFADILLPDKWNKYVKIITGLIIISAIASPVKNKINFDISRFFRESEQIQLQGEDYSKQLMKKELTDRINTDCEQRLKDEFNIPAIVSCKLSINEYNEITGVDIIEITAKGIDSKVIDRLNEIYAPKEVMVYGN